MVAEREYVLTKIGTGDYLLPSNDARTIWRIAAYMDGPTYGIADWPKDRRVWGLWRYTEFFSMPYSHGPHGQLDVDNWDHWEMVANTFNSRKEAIDAAMRLGTK